MKLKEMQEKRNGIVEDMKKMKSDADVENRAVDTEKWDELNSQVKELDAQSMVLRSVHRSHLWLIQTPQIFQFEDINLAHQKAIKDGWEEATDDAFLIEKMGIPVKIIEGEESNIKVTTPRDLDIARFLMSKINT